jgi:iron complex transport system substrate-binding protein
MEWVKVFSACYDLNDQTMAAFDSVVSSYESLKMLAANDNNKPAVLLGLPWRGTWYVSGAQSYIARLIKDAGGSYIWQNMDYNESRPMGLEKIYEKALAADYWINPGEARSTNDILSVDERFGMLPCVVNDKIYNNNNQLTPLGGNDFYETGVVEPDVILSDLICILHPQLLPSHKLKYYRKLQKTR